MSNHFYDEGEAATGKKVLLATTCYDKTAASYTFSIARSREALHKEGIQTAYLLLQGNCHVDDARNSVVRDFLESDCTDLVFLDADVDWEPADLLQLCKRELDVVGGVYPYRRDGSENMPCRMMDDRRMIDGLIEVEGLPTGFLKIKRHVLEKVAAQSPKYFDGIHETALVFDRPDPGPDKTRWGGDIAFCNKWRALGGRLFADAELRLGHTGAIILRDSLAASIRRMSGTTLSYVIPRVREGIERETDYNEAFKYVGNNYAADAPLLATVTALARKCRGPIIETGSGLSSVFMGAVSDSQVYSLEHAPQYAAQTVAWCEDAGVPNVGVCYAPLKDFWYDVDKFDLPQKFSLGFCDGPPRFFGTRMRFFEVFGDRCSAILVDDVKSDINFLNKVAAWAESKGRHFQILGRAALITKPEALLKAA
jgi:hypothetical protein